MFSDNGRSTRARRIGGRSVVYGNVDIRNDYTVINHQSLASTSTKTQMQDEGRTEHTTSFLPPHALSITRK